MDNNRLMFVRYKNVEKGGFSLMGYRNKRLSFGLRASPSILTLALHKILLLDMRTVMRKLLNSRSQYSI